MYKEDLALNNLQWLRCHKTKLNQSKPNLKKKDWKNRISEEGFDYLNHSVTVISKNTMKSPAELRKVAAPAD